MSTENYQQTDLTAVEESFERETRISIRGISLWVTRLRFELDPESNYPTILCYNPYLIAIISGVEASQAVDRQCYRLVENPETKEIERIDYPLQPEIRERFAAFSRRTSVTG